MPRFMCPICGTVCSSAASLSHHKRKQHPFSKVAIPIVEDFKCHHQKIDEGGQQNDAVGKDGSKEEDSPVSSKHHYDHVVDSELDLPVFCTATNSQKDDDNRNEECVEDDFDVDEDSNLFGESIYNDTETTESSKEDNIDEISVTQATPLSGEMKGNNKNVKVAEAELLYLMSQYSLPANAYTTFMEWAHRASSMGYNFKKSAGFRVTVDRVLRNHMAPHAIVHSTTVKVGAIPEVEVYHFSFLENIKRFVHSKELMENSLWKYNGKSNVYSELNTGKWWYAAENRMKQRLRSLSKLRIRMIICWFL